jgi:hypothetical protein
MHVENPPHRDGLGDVRLPTLVPKGEGPGAPPSWFRELAEIGATRPGCALYSHDSGIDAFIPHQLSITLIVEFARFEILSYRVPDHVDSRVNVCVPKVKV